MGINVFEVFAKIGADTHEFDKSLNNSKNKLSGFSEGLTKFGGKVFDVFSEMGKAAAAGIGIASGALTSLTKQSLAAVADYEQLAGGVEKIFGESAQKVKDFANQAYKTAGLSANEYMESVTGFSASLLQSLEGDTQKTADYANRALIDMSDNVNTYGSNMQDVMNAYMGFSKQNYTMLDNLKLGYGGTQAEMKRLIADASTMTDEMKALGVTVDADSMSFGNIVNAISVMQKRMKIAGTTSKEAASTISGSMTSLKAAWKNLLAGTGDTSQFTDILSVSVSNVSKNINEIVPRLTESIGILVDNVAPELPTIFEGTLPTIISSSSMLITELAKKLPQLLRVIIPALSSGVINVTSELVKTLPQLVKPFGDTAKIIGKEIIDNADSILSAGNDILGMFVDSITKGKALQKLGTAAGDIVKNLADGLTDKNVLSQFVNTAPDIIAGVVDGLITFLTGSEKDGTGGLLGAATQIVKNIGDYFSNEQNRADFLEGAKKFIRSLAEGAVTLLKSGAPLLVEAGKAWIALFCGSIDYDAGAREIAKQLAAAFARNFGNGFKGLWNLVTNPNETIDNWLYGGDANMYYDRLGQRISDALLTQWNETDTPLSVEDWAAVQQVRNQYGNLPYSDENLLEWIESGTTLNFDEFFSDYERRRRFKDSNPELYVPGFAEGGIISKPTLALIGEAGREAVVPLENNTEWVDKLANKISDYAGYGNIVVNVYATSNNPQEIAKATAQEIDEQMRYLQIQRKRGVGAIEWQM